MEPFIKASPGRNTDIRDFTVDEVKDRGLLERELRKVLDEEFVTGKAWEF